MLRDFLTNKWTRGGIIFLILLSGACALWLWYQYDTAPDKREIEKTVKPLRQLKTPSNTDTDNKVKQVADINAVKSTPHTPEKPIPQTKPEVVDNITGAEVTQEKQTEPSTDTVKVDVRVSPFGFGAYPTIPAVYRDLGGIEDIWAVYEKMAETDPDTARMNELGERVLIKLWEQGLQPTGGKHKNGRFYPDYPNTVYVTWTEEVLEDGTVERFPTAVSGDPAFAAYETEFMESDGEVFPSGWTMLDSHKDGIDPYQFLQ